MAINYRGLRSLTTNELLAALSPTVFLSAREVLHHVAPHAGGDTFSVKTLQTIIATQARWTEDDVQRLKLIR